MLLSRTAKYLALHVNSPLGLPSQAKIPFIQNINLQTECFFSVSQNYKRVLWEGNK
jgi:hypothetical protein